MLVRKVVRVEKMNGIPLIRKIIAKGDLPIWHHVPKNEYDFDQEDNPASVYSDNAVLEELCEGDPHVKGLLELDVVLEKMAGEEMAKVFDAKENERLENQVSSIGSQ